MRGLETPAIRRNEKLDLRAPNGDRKPTVAWGLRESGLLLRCWVISERVPVARWAPPLPVLCGGGGAFFMATGIATEGFESLDEARGARQSMGRKASRRAASPSCSRAMGRCP